MALGLALQPRLLSKSVSLLCPTPIPSHCPSFQSSGITGKGPGKIWQEPLFYTFPKWILNFNSVKPLTCLVNTVFSQAGASLILYLMKSSVPTQFCPLLESSSNYYFFPLLQLVTPSSVDALDCNYFDSIYLSGNDSLPNSSSLQPQKQVPYEIFLIYSCLAIHPTFLPFGQILMCKQRKFSV